MQSKTLNPIFEIAKSNYGDEHRLFAQIMMSMGVIKVEKVGSLFKKACNHIGKNKIQNSLPKDQCKKLAKVLAENMNTKLETVGLSLVFQYDECIDDLEYLILISEIDHSDSLKVTGSFSPEQFELFQHWLKQIFNPENEQFGEISVADALNNSKTPLMQNKNQNLIMNNAQIFMDELKAKRWIIVQNGIFRLHARTLKELDPVLRSDEYDLPNCTLCKRIVTVRRFAHQCNFCDNYAHKTCITRFLKRHNPINCGGKTLEGEICDGKFTLETLQQPQNHLPMEMENGDEHANEEFFENGIEEPMSD